MNISFALTTDQVRRRIKTETRRLKWDKLVAASKRGEQPILQGIVKGQGLKKGEHPEFITDIRVVRAWREPLNLITPEAVVREGFPGKTPEWFVEMFCEHNTCEPKTKISVISFEYPWHVEYLHTKHVIVAGRRLEAEQFAYENHWRPDQWMYPTNPHEVVGMSSIKVHRVGTFSQRSDYPELMDYLRQREMQQAQRWWSTSRDSLEFQLKSTSWAAASISPIPQVKCPFDTDNDGNCHIHPHGCPK